LQLCCSSVAALERSSSSTSASCSSRPHVEHLSLHMLQVCPYKDTDTEERVPDASSVAALLQLCCSSVAALLQLCCSSVAALSHRSWSSTGLLCGLICLFTLAYVSIRQHPSASGAREACSAVVELDLPLYEHVYHMSLNRQTRQQTSAYVSIRQHVYRMSLNRHCRSTSSAATQK
jgi:hypothetical protein